MEAIPRKFSPDELVALTAAQKRQENKEFDARKAASEMALRQWCVEQAVNLWVKDTSVHRTPESMAQAILDFVSAPLKPEAPNGNAG